MPEETAGVVATRDGKDYRVRDDRLTAEGRALRKRGGLAPAKDYGMSLEDFWNLDASSNAELFLCEVLALRICASTRIKPLAQLSCLVISSLKVPAPADTTAAYWSLNNPFRESLKHGFPVTINFLKSAICKLRAVESMGGKTHGATVDLCTDRIYARIYAHAR